MKCRDCTKKKTTKRLFGCPFICEVCGETFLEAKAILDVVFIWPVPKPKNLTKDSVILLPDILTNPENELRGRSPFGIVVSKGDGFFYPSGDFLSLSGLSVGDLVLYDYKLPNISWFYGMDKKEYPVVRCGYLDLATIVELDEDEDVNCINSVT